MQASNRSVSADVITTPGVAYLTRSHRFSAGVVVSASHNPWMDNGIMLFGRDGMKLGDAIEFEIEHEVSTHQEDSARDFHPSHGKDVAAQESGAVATMPGLCDSYLQWLHASLEPFKALGLRVLVDCANGAAALVAPKLFRMRGLAATFLNISPNGRNINVGCGALHPEHVASEVRNRKQEFDLGITFDGDGDRALFCDENGKVVNGDAVMLIAAREMKRRGTLAQNIVVATTMSHVGLEGALQRSGICMLRASYGEKYVLEEMLRTGAKLGGLQSGHILFMDGAATTGDGLLTALRVLDVLASTGCKLSELLADLKNFPQVIRNIKVREKVPLAQLPLVAKAIKAAESELGNNGRIVVRYAGSENLARVMVEAESEEVTHRISQSVADAFEHVIEGERESSPSEYVGLALLDGEFRLFTMLADGTYRYLDPSGRLYDLIYTYSSETRALECAIEELEDLLNSRATSEADFQRFFEDNPDFIISDGHIEALADVYLTREGEPTLKPDFVLKPLDPQRTSDLLELKLPSAQVYVLKSRRARLSQAVMEARAQLMEYARYFDETTNREFVEGAYGVFAYRPRMFVLIGRRGDISPVIRRTAELTAEDLHVSTYDDIIERMRHKVTSMMGGRR
jgi:phosphoglucosamine mutase